MEMEKILNLSDVELTQQERQAGEQLFRLRFQMRMGQNEGLQKLRGLKKDIARIKTATRQRQLGLATVHAVSTESEAPKAAKAKSKVTPKVAHKAAVKAKSKTEAKAKKAAAPAAKKTAASKTKGTATKPKAAKKVKTVKKETR